MVKSQVRKGKQVRTQLQDLEGDAALQEREKLEWGHGHIWRLRDIIW